VFLSADHGVVDVPQYLKDQRMHAGYFSISRTRVLLEEYLEQFYPGRKLIEYMNFGNVYLNHEAFSDAPQTAAFDMMLVSELIAKFLLTQEGIANVYTESVLRQASYGEEGIRGLIMRGYHPKRAGDILYVLEPGFADWSRPQGSTHGSPYTYDTHVPILFYGKGIRKGSSHQYYSVTQIAPTISALLEIKFPSGATGQPIAEVLAK
jgi:arylsulfatase A-like enzyme